MSKPSEASLTIQASNGTTSASAVVRALRIGGKPISRAVFRQLTRRQLLDLNEPNLLEPVLGWVNYAPPGEDKHATQFIAQFGDELCRCPFRIRKASPALDVKPMIRLRERQRACAEVLLFWDVLNYDDYMRFAGVGDEEAKCLQEDRRWFHRPMMLDLYVDRGGYLGEASVGPYWRFAELVQSFLYAYDEDDKNTLRESIEARMSSLGFGAEVPEFDVREAMDECSRQAEAYAERWDELMAQLKATPQFFITV